MDTFKNNILNSDFSRGFLVGISQVIIGHPFDTIKTNMQTNKKIYINKVYKGVSFPFFSHSFINSGLFGIYDYNSRYNNNHFISGAISGLLMSPIICPLDKLKIDYQNRNKKKLTEINFKNIYRGFYITILRESVSSGIYFSSYHSLKSYEYIKGDMNIFLSGGIAGALSWIITYPIDVIKTRIQNNPSISIIDAFKKGEMFKGFQICILRSFLVNSIGFFIYEKLK